MRMIKFKVNFEDLLHLITEFEPRYLLYHQGKITAFLTTSKGEPVLFHAEMKEKPKGSFVMYNLFNNNIKWVNHIKKTSDVIYIPVIRVEKVEGLEW